MAFVSEMKCFPLGLCEDHWLFLGRQWHLYRIYKLSFLATQICGIFECPIEGTGRLRVGMG